MAETYTHPSLPMELLVGDEEAAPKNKYEAEDRELLEAGEHIWNIAHEYQLDPFQTHFEVVPPRIMSQNAAYLVPGRFSHWTRGREYRNQRTMYDYGYSKIYEMVINSDPAEAFLLENNPPIDNKFVMAHVLGHTDFFKNNYVFAETRRDMPEAMVANAARIRKYEDRYGRMEVEQLLDATLAIGDHIDPYGFDRPWRDEEIALWKEEARQKQLPKVREPNEFDAIFEIGRKKEETVQALGARALHIPPTPDRDIVGFIRNHAPYLEDWQRDVLDIAREESLYFYPQRRTKIMNEGWAAYWHMRIMREMSNRELITDEEDERWWKIHSGVVAPSKQLNPYYLGVKIYEYIEDRYNGNLTKKEREWLESEGEEVYPHFDGPLKYSPAMDKLRDVMMTNDDQSFIRNYFDRNVAERLHMFIYEEAEYNGKKYQVVKSNGWKEIRESLVNMLENSGSPLITVVDGDYKNSGGLYLRHEFDGRTLDPEYINKTLPFLHQLWQRAVYLETVTEERKVVRYFCNGEGVTTA